MLSFPHPGQAYASRLLCWRVYFLAEHHRRVSGYHVSVLWDKCLNLWHLLLCVADKGVQWRRIDGLLQGCSCLYTYIEFEIILMPLPCLTLVPVCLSCDPLRICLWLTIRFFMQHIKQHWTWVILAYTLFFCVLAVRPKVEEVSQHYRKLTCIPCPLWQQKVGLSISRTSLFLTNSCSAFLAWLHLNIISCWALNKYLAFEQVSCESIWSFNSFVLFAEVL